MNFERKRLEPMQKPEPKPLITEQDRLDFIEELKEYEDPNHVLPSLDGSHVTVGQLLRFTEEGNKKFEWYLLLFTLHKKGKIAEYREPKKEEAPKKTSRGIRDAIQDILSKLVLK